MPPTSKPAPPLRAQRVLLWAVAVLMWLNAVATVAETGGFFGIGAAVPTAAAGAVAAVLARALRGGRRWVRVAVVALYLVILAGEIGRLRSGDPRALIGVLFPIAGLALLLPRSARAHFGGGR